MHRPLLSTGSPQTRFPQDGSQRWYVLQNWRQDVAVIIDETAQPPRTQRERVFFSEWSRALRSGGRVFGPLHNKPAGDTGVSGSAFDGNFDGADDTAITGWTGYDAYVDVDLDGDVDTADAEEQMW